MTYNVCDQFFIAFCSPLSPSLYDKPILCFDFFYSTFKLDIVSVISSGDNTEQMVELSVTLTDLDWNFEKFSEQNTDIFFRAAHLVPYYIHKAALSVTIFDKNRFIVVSICYLVYFMIALVIGRCCR